jgi:steroid delta-isomerase-like uncharacterized protein
VPSDDVLRVFLDHWNAHDLDRLVALYHPDAVMRDPTLDQPLTGTAQLRRYYATMWQANPAARLACDGVTVTERAIVWLWRFTPAPDRGGPTAVGATLFVLTDGKIAADDAIWDPSSL